MASLAKDFRVGTRIEDGLLIGTKAWFRAIAEGRIQRRVVAGIISRVYMSGHNDYREFEIQTDEGHTSTWAREGRDNAYVVGSRVELIYVEQKTKPGVKTKCVIEINICCK